MIYVFRNGEGNGGRRMQVQAVPKIGPGRRRYCLRTAAVATGRCLRRCVSLDRSAKDHGLPFEQI